MAHANFGPSSSERWLACPGSIKLAENAPKPPTTPSAAEGTLAHQLAQQYLEGALDTLELTSRIGVTELIDGHEIEVTEEMVDAVLDYASAIEKDIESLRSIKAAPPVLSAVEMRVKAASISPLVWGTADSVVYRLGHKLIVRDLKYGKGHQVTAEENTQMAIYAIGVMDQLGTRAFDTVELVVHQPRRGGETRWTTTPKWLDAFGRTVAAAVAEAEKPNARLASGEWCRWCPAAPVCPALQKKAQELAQVQFAEPPAPLKDPKLLPVADAVRALMWEDVIDAYFNSIRAMIETRLLAGEEIPGVKLVEGRATRVWANKSEAEAYFSRRVGALAYTEPELKSPAQMEIALGKNKAAKEEVEKHTVKTQGKLTVALDSDPRPPARRAAALDFDPIQ